MADDSWFIIYRKDLEELTHIELLVMVHLTARARWNGNKRDRRYLIDLEPGQFVYGERELAEACHCSQSGLRKAIKNLVKSAHLGITQRSAKGSLGFIAKKSRYQFEESADSAHSAHTNLPIPKPEPELRTVGQEASKPPISSVDALAKQVIAEFNRITGKTYPLSKTSLKHITARLQEPDPPPLKDIIDMITFKNNEWKEDPDMRTFVRPQTLFNSEKFEGYIVEMRAVRARQEMYINELG